MSLNEKLDTIRELIAQRDEIDRQLESIIGGSLETLPLPKQTSTQPKERGQRRQVSTGKRRGVGFEERTVKILELAAKGVKPQVIADKLGCSKQTVYNTITRKGGGMSTIRKGAPAPAATPAPDTKPLGVDQYDQLRAAMYDRDFSSAKYALTHRLSPREVNAAIRSSSYDDYIDNR